ncbi:hypothetical protein BDW02DRAFT_337750 [Decorospora gaudefroyi]|uniref:Uncharacterized protein n=1 Tax=Decorospora gaudefroyi TaxID=184978 RepID=A0A6A5KU40_9PLEO|nr:hypothetical protein BDW02DRAFT_337750 [Decorospora gaudefroyi]
MRPPASVSKPEPQATGLRRSQSLRKPAAATQTLPSAAPATHARTQSTSTVTAARRDTSNSTTGSERPKSLLVAPSRSSKTSHVSAATLPGPARASTRSAGLHRSASTKTKNEASNGVAGAPTVPRAEEPLATQSKRREPAADEVKKSSRPAFSTLQQHFTPRKTGKAPTATFLNPAPAPASNSLPAEIVHLQAELLQLHLLHQASAQVSARWEQSAKRSLRTKFEEVASLYHIMLEHERSASEQTNLQSLLDWTPSNAALAHHIQTLSTPLDQLPSLVEPGGRLHRLESDFERWLSSIQTLRSAREDAGSTIEPLGSAWKAENEALTRKITALAGALDTLAPSPPGSSIEAVGSACTQLLGGMLEELELMRKIETDVVASEKVWVDRCLEGIEGVGMGMGMRDGETPPAWSL